MDEQDREQLRHIALGGAQAMFFSGIVILFLLPVFPHETLWVGYLFGPLYVLVGVYIWWALARFRWTMHTNSSDND